MPVPMPPQYLRYRDDLGPPHRAYSILHDRPEFKEALGSIVANWCLIEVEMVRILGELIRSNHLDSLVDPATLIFYATSNHKAQRDLIEILGCAVNKAYDCDPRPLAKLLKRIKAAATKRNDFVHGQWCLLEKTDEIILASFRPLAAIAEEIRTVAIKEMRRDADFIAEVAYEAACFSLRAEHKPSPHTWLMQPVGH